VIAGVLLARTRHVRTQLSASPLLRAVGRHYVEAAKG
jgi:hypothetical protein